MAQTVSAAAASDGAPLAGSDHPAVGPLDPAFVEDCLYTPEALLFDEIIAIDADAGRVRVRMPTHDELPITRLQRHLPPRHPRHVSGGLLVHLTGMVAFVHFYYVLGLRAAEGWTGFGVRIHDARYPNLTRMGPPLELDCEATRVRKVAGKLVTRYRFRFYQEDKLVYSGDQTAMWMQVDDDAAGPGGA